MESIFNSNIGNDIDDGQAPAKRALKRRGCTSEDILRLLVYSPLENKPFVPNGALEELITFDAVTSTLAAVGLTVGEQRCLARVIVEKGKRIFAILVFINQVSEIKTLFREGFTDEKLPVAYQAEGDDSWKVRSYLPNSDKLTQDQGWVFFQRWEKTTIFSFCERQWMFLSPIFRRDQFKYILHRNTILPFVSDKGQIKQSFFSMVFHVEVHAAHQSFRPGLDRPLDCAIKELAAPDIENTFEKESNALACMRDIDHKHLITCIAAVQKEQRYFFVFPWADGGNLREFWASDNCAMPNTQSLPWAISQMRGLADALTELHNINTRHGDLKPENILRFSDDTIKGHGRLVIADVGLAKVHTNTTRSRNFPTSTVTGTARYEAPEAFLSGQSRSRAYDVWSMGCIFVEFVTWLLHGSELLQKLNSSFESFAHDTQGGMISPLDQVAQNWMDHMLRDPRCARNTALGEILNFTKRRLLVPIQSEGNEPSRATAKELLDHLVFIELRCSNNEAYLFGSDDWEELGRSNLSRFNLGASLLLLHTISKGRELTLQIKRGKRATPLCQCIGKNGSTEASYVLQKTSPEPTTVEIEPKVTAEPSANSEQPLLSQLAPPPAIETTQESSSRDLPIENPGSDTETDLRHKSSRSTTFDFSSSESCWSASASSGYSHDSASSLGEEVMEGASQDDIVLENLVKHKTEDMTNKTMAWFSCALGSSLTLAAYQRGETSAAGNAAPCPGKLVGDDARQPPTQKKRKGIGRDKKDESDDGEDSAEEDDRKGKGKKKPRTSVNRSKKLACPFFKRNPELYGKNMTCRGHSWGTVHRVKEHLFRVHMQPEGRCHRCLVVFEDVSCLQQHQRQPTPCPIAENTDGEAYIDAKTAQKLRRKSTKGLLPKQSEFVKWKEMFSLLFPGIEPIPSPYFDDAQEKRSELEVIQDFSSFAVRELRAEMEKHMVESGIEESLRATLFKHFQSSQSKIQKKYLQKQRHDCSTATESEGESPPENATAQKVEERSPHGGSHDESGKENDTRNVGGGEDINLIALDSGSSGTDNSPSRGLHDENLIPNLLPNINPYDFFSEIAPIASVNPSNYTAPASLQSTAQYPVHNNAMNDNRVNPALYSNMHSFAQNLSRYFPVVSDTAPAVLSSTEPGQYNLASNAPDPDLTPVPSPIRGRANAAAALPSYAPWHQTNSLGLPEAAGRLQNMHYNRYLEAGGMGANSRMGYPISQLEASFAYNQPSLEQCLVPRFYDSGYITSASQTTDRLDDALLKKPVSKDCEPEMPPKTYSQA
ncbi:hypothetical protein F4777DRAFT_598394 [Nemania sp. FL0916]|nr:hypothetical protein F4777DRAFT_598394 [Nemania sp. FL0916]